LVVAVVTTQVVTVVAVEVATLEVSEVALMVGKALDQVLEELPTLTLVLEPLTFYLQKLLGQDLETQTKFVLVKAMLRLQGYKENINAN
jgi:hypothetical protein